MSIGQTLLALTLRINKKLENIVRPKHLRT